MQTLSKRFQKSILSIIIVLIASLIQYIFWPIIKPAPFLLFYPAVILSCLYGNGMLSIILSGFFGHLLFTEPYLGVPLIWPNDHVRMFFFILSCLLVRNVVAKLQKSKKESETVLNSLLEERAERENFVSALTHDLQTPLTAIRLATQLITKKMNDPEVIRKNSDRIIHNVSRIEQMVQDILDTNKIRAGAPLSLEIKEMELHSFIESVVSELNLIHHQRFQLECDSQIYGHWSPEAVRRIIENLCSNAIKYGEDKSLVYIRVKQQPSEVLIEVHNQGPPIPVHEQSNLFDLYKRSQSARKSGKKGWGLGLTLVKGLTVSMGGKVQVRSEDNYGTCFTVCLPVDVRQKVAI